MEKIFDFVLLKIIQLFEISAVFIFSFVLVLDFFIPFNEISTYYFIFGLSLSWIIKSLSLKSKELKVNLFILLLYTVCIFSNLFESFFYLYYLSLFLYISIFKNLKTSILNLIFSIILILFISNYFKHENVGEIGIIFNIIIPRVIFVFSLISITIILLLQEIISLLKLKVDLSYQQTGELTTKEIEQEKLIEQLKQEAEINEKSRIKLSNSKQYFINIFNNVSDCIIIIKVEGGIVLANKCAYKKYGFTEETIKTINYFDLITPEFRKNVPKRLIEIKQKGQHFFESEHLDANNMPFRTEISTRFIIFEDEEVLMIIIKDISERKAKEQKEEKIKEDLRKKVLERTAQLEDAMDELRVEIQNNNKTEHDLRMAKDELIKSLEIEKEYSELKNRFVSMISHEYITPLTGILSYTYILERYFDIQDKVNFKTTIEKIHKSISAMTILLEDVLKMGKSDSEIAHVQINKFDILNTYNEVINEMKFIEKAPHIYNLESKYKSIIINSDENLITQIFRNLISNSAKYSAKDTTITTLIIIENDYLILSIKDEGIGIPDEDINHLFEPFFRSGNVGAREGTGLGLALVKKYVKALVGSIEIESELNKGTTIILTFPVSNYIAVKKD